MVIPVKEMPAVAIRNVVHDDFCRIECLFLLRRVRSVLVAVFRCVDMGLSRVFIRRMCLFRSQNGWRCHQEKT